GIYLIPSTGSNNYDLSATEDYRKNRKYKVSAAKKLTADGSTNRLYFPLDESYVRFVSYYPYASGATSSNTVSFAFADQSTQAKKEAQDFCFHRGTVDYKKGSSPKFTFSHKFSQISMTVKQGDGGPSVKNIQVKLSGMPKTTEVDLNKLSQQQTGSITVSTDSVTVKAYTHDGSTDTEATVEAIIAPHSATGKFAKRVFTFTTEDGEEKTYELPNTVTFEAGKSYNYTFTLVPGISIFDGMTNCYIVAPDTELTFPVSRAYTYNGTKFSTKLHTGGTYTSTFTAAVVWADAAVINGTPTVTGSGNTAEVTVKTTSTSGNAVVKICKYGETTPVWSYHIWVTDYDPNAAGATYTNTKNTNNKSNLVDGHFVFMDRNLGATKAGLGSGIGTGLFYQWGRKDPFPATLAPGATQPGSGSFTAVATTSARGTVTNTIKNPGVFYWGVSGTDYDWHYASRDNTLWGHDVNGGIKTIYDPCPSGWRVPVNYNMSEASSPWYGFTKANGGSFSYGYNWGTNAVYPAAGYRLTSSGSLANVDSYGYYWSASPNSSASANALLLNFYYANIYVYYNTSRAYGFSVRCVKE
ncbi:MAG: fimbrillin family protein, partial [Mediterranea sp.]|nr:fimbrillin family protein [Mediterranea sp.]